MGANLARNAARKGFKVSVYNRRSERTEKLLAEHGDEGVLQGSTDLEAFVQSIARPRPIVIMVKAGKPVDEVMEELIPYLDEGDILIDAGNSLFTDTERRSAEMAQKGLRFFGMGVSGGEEGALLGPSIMPSGDKDAWARIEPFVMKMAAQVDGEPCAAYIGPGGSGHYVKMVHNGIEYADMQLIAEAYDIMRGVHGISAGEIAEIFKGWQKGPLDSYLIDITVEVLSKVDTKSNKPLVDMIVDEAEQKGTGRWTAQSALELGVPITAITEAVYARGLSSRRSQRDEASRLFKVETKPPFKASAAELADLHAALYASKIVAYAQGFEQLAVASNTYGWDLDLGTLAKIWRGGCIIRAAFLDRIREMYAKEAPANMLFGPYFADAMQESLSAWRRTVARAIESGTPVPAFSSCLAYFDGLRRARGPANLLQGLRDYFGAHTYRRLDKEGSFHTRWSQDGSEIDA
ncbi:6-phosphogluconate dehydrogenase [Arboricoccus pini]|uniref:6-phosphogluconate dehydrogenase, decarboxylating n=2 Tax=Arboricoccus pini TaxID=1963835 RepID=A0A212RNP0_9PROT|nr:6-phosphogluconate dehydrogenase [Arboricoccus pini]